MMLNFVLLAMLIQVSAATPASEGREIEQAGEQMPVSAEWSAFPAFPEELRGYLDCRMVNSEREVLGDLEIITFEALNDADCDDELDNARAELLVAFQRRDSKAPSAMNRAMVEFYVGRIHELPSPGSISFFDESELGPASYTVPEGLWEYHVCRNSIPVHLNGKRVEPRFPDDPNCDRARAFSRAAALQEFKRLGEPSTEAERTDLVDQYIQEIDARTRSRDARTMNLNVSQ